MKGKWAARIAGGAAGLANGLFGGGGGMVRKVHDNVCLSLYAVQGLQSALALSKGVHESAKLSALVAVLHQTSDLFAHAPHGAVDDDFHFFVPFRP